MTTTFLPTQKQHFKKTYLTFLFVIPALVSFIYFFGSIAAQDRLPDPMPMPPAVANQDLNLCPEGSYNIGPDYTAQEKTCKLEPTGCVHGDSISLEDCDKFSEENITSQNIDTVEKPVDSVYNSNIDTGTGK